MDGTFDRFVRLLGRTVMIAGIAAGLFGMVAAWRMSAPPLLLFAAFAAVSAWYGHRVAGRIATERVPFEAQVRADLAA